MASPIGIKVLTDEDINNFDQQRKTLTDKDIGQLNKQSILTDEDINKIDLESKQKKLVLPPTSAEHTAGITDPLADIRIKKAQELLAAGGPPPEPPIDVQSLNKPDQVRVPSAIDNLKTASGFVSGVLPEAQPRVSGLLGKSAEIIFKEGQRYPKAFMSAVEQMQLGNIPTSEILGKEIPSLFPGVYAPTMQEERTPTQISWDIADRFYKKSSTNVAWEFIKLLPFSTAGLMSEFHLNPGYTLLFGAINKVITSPEVAKFLGKEIPAPKWLDDAIKGTIKGFYRPFEGIIENVKESRINGITDEIYKKFLPRMEELRTNYKASYGVNPTEGDIRGLIKAKLVQQGIYEAPLRDLQGKLFKARRTKPLTPKVEPQPKPPVKPTGNVRSIGGIVRQMGGIDPGKAKASGYPTESFKGFGLTYLLKQGGQGVDEIAQELLSTGQLTPQQGESPSEALMRVLKDKTKTAEHIKTELDKQIKQEEQDEQFKKQITESGAGSPEEIRRFIDLEINTKTNEELEELLRTKQFTSDADAESFIESLNKQGAASYLEYDDAGNPVVQYVLPEDVKVISVVKEVSPELVEQAEKAPIVAPAKDLKGKVPIVEGEAELIQEAKKYKTAEEFAETQPIYYRGGKGNNWVSPNKEFAEQYGKLRQVNLSPNANLFDVIGDSVDELASEFLGEPVVDSLGSTDLWYQPSKEFADFLIKKGYDGFINDKNIFIANKDVIKTKSQITDIWDKAQKPATQKEAVKKAVEKEPKEEISALEEPTPKESETLADKIDPDKYPGTTSKLAHAYKEILKYQLEADGFGQRIIARRIGDYAYAFNEDLRHKLESRKIKDLAKEDDFIQKKVKDLLDQAEKVEIATAGENIGEIAVEISQLKQILHGALTFKSEFSEALNISATDLAELSDSDRLVKKAEDGEPKENLSAKKWSVEMPKDPITKEKINKTQILQWVEKNFKVPIRGKATSRMRALGRYYNKAELIRLKTWGELEVLTHEIAHHIDAKVMKRLSKHWRKEIVPAGEKKAAIRELANLDYNKKERRTKEGFAEFMRYYLTTDEAAHYAPKFYRYFTTNFMPYEPEGAKITQLKKMMETWQKQGAENRMLAQTDWKGEHTKIGGIETKIQKAKYLFLKNWVDEFYPIMRVEDQMGLKPGTGKVLRPTEDPFIMLTYSKAKAGLIARTFVMDKAIDEYHKVVGPGLLDVLKDIPVDKIRQWIIYGIARRTVEVLEPRKIETGFEIEDAKYIIKKYKSGIFDDAVEGVTKWGDHLLDWVVRAGGLSPEEKELIRTLNPIWLPFKRAFIDNIQLIQGGGSLVNKGQVIKGIKGSGKPVLNPLETMITQTTEFIAKAQRIRIGSLLADLVNRPGAGRFITEIPAPMEATTFSLEKIKKDLELLGVDLAGVNLDAFLTVFTQGWQYKGKDNIVSIWKNGKRKFFEIDPDLYRAITGVDPLQLMPLLKIIAPFARTVRLGATGLRIAFGLYRNPFKDAFTYAVNSKQKHALIFDPLLGVYKELTAKPGELAWRFKKGGGSLSGMIGFDRDAAMSVYDDMMWRKLKATGKSLMVVKHPVQALAGLVQNTREIISWSELGPRTIEVMRMYEKYRKENPNWTDEDCYVMAFNDGQDVTVNFTKSGRYGKKVNAVSAFFNVAIQGPEKIYRVYKNNPKGFILKGLLWITLPAILMWYKNRKKQWYQNLPPAYKYNNFFFEIGDDIYRLGVPFDLGILFASVPQAALDTLIEKDPQYVEGLMDQIKMQIPDPTPSVFRPWYEVKTNRNFLGQPIESEGMQREFITERKRYYTTSFASWLSKGFFRMGIQLSPVQVDHYIKGYSGGFTRQLPAKSYVEKADLPVLGEAILRMPENPKRQMNNFFIDYEVLSQKKASDIATKEELNKLRKIKPYYYQFTRIYFKNLKKYREVKDLDKLKAEYEKITEVLRRAGYN